MRSHTAMSTAQGVTITKIVTHASERRCDEGRTFFFYPTQSLPDNRDPALPCSSLSIASLDHQSEQINAIGESGPVLPRTLPPNAIVADVKPVFTLRYFRHQYAPEVMDVQVEWEFTGLLSSNNGLKNRFH